MSINYDNEQRTGNLSKLRSIKRNINKNPKIKIDISKTEYLLIRSLVTSEFNWKFWGKQDQKDDANIIWVDSYITQQWVKRLKPYQKVNHFPGSFELGKKNFLSNNINFMKKILPEEYNFYPNTWIFPQQYEQYLKFQKQNPQKYFISKPVSGSQGRGITIENYVNQVQKEELVVQQYLDNPLLLDNFKFDFRIYVLLKSLFPLKIFIYKEGLTRLATQSYAKPNASNLSNLNMHLTNYAINKTSPYFIQNKTQQNDHIGHKRSYSTAIAQLSQKGCNIERLQQQINAIVIKTILATYNKLSETYRRVRQVKEQDDSVCFQILGFDILILEDFTPKLIEVNHSPSFCTDSPLDYVIKKCLLLDTLNLLNLNNQDKVQYLKKKSCENTNKSFSKNIKNSPMKICIDIHQKMNSGYYRKIYNSNKFNIANIQDNRFDAITEKIIGKNQLKYLKKKIRPKIDQFKTFDQKQDNQEFIIPENICSYTQRQKNYFNYTYRNLFGKQHYKKEIKQKESMEKQIRRHLFVQRDKKKIINPVKINNVNLDFEGEISRNNVISTSNQSRKQNKFIASHRSTSAAKSYETAIPKTEFETIYTMTNNAQFFEHQDHKFQSQLKNRIDKMKIARIKLQKIKKMERILIGNAFGFCSQYPIL